MTFKEQLIAKAEQLDIQDDVNYIKKQMEVYFDRRQFSVNFIVPNNSGFAIGGGEQGNYTDFFVPKNYSPESYRQVFVDAFKELGFTDNDITLEEQFNHLYGSYNIILRW